MGQAIGSAAKTGMAAPDDPAGVGVVVRASDTLVIGLEGPTDWAGFRQACRVLLAEGIAPERVRWRWRGLVGAEGGAHTDLFSAQATGTAAGRTLAPQDLEHLPTRPGEPLRLTRAQLRTLQGASLHADPGRFELCHRWLHRVRAAPALRDDVLDADWRALEQRAHAVGREIHKMHAFVRFRCTERAGEPDLHVAWFEPVHHIVQAAAPFFVRRFANMHWAILTPQLCLHWDGTQLQQAPGARRADAPPPDAGEALWLTYYASTFNPARLKQQAMKREMPRRYWSNLPEAALISPLLAQARARAGRMLEALPSEPVRGADEVPPG